MEALVALIGAVFEAVFLPVLTILEIAAAGLAAAVEFAVYSLFQGREKASQRYTQRNQDRAENRDRKIAAKRRPYVSQHGNSQFEAGPTPEEDEKMASDARQGCWMIAAFLIVVIIATTVVIRKRTYRARVKQTSLTVHQVLDRVSNQIRKEEPIEPESGFQIERDAWSNEVELLVDKYLMGQLIVVRSLGPNCRVGGGDDVFAADLIGSKFGDIAAELASVGVDAIKEKALNLLKRNDAAHE